jgi:DNA invertase Pin-like site-specific DNA recombinase
MARNRLPKKERLLSYDLLVGKVVNGTGEQAAIWARVSTQEQATANQTDALRSWAQARGFEIVTTYELEESAFNGKHRAKLNEALDDARLGRYTVLLVWALDRLSREGPEAMLAVMRQFRERGVRVLSLQESWTDGPPEMQELLSAFFGWMAKQESVRRSERTKAGLARRRAQGVVLGRPVGSRDRKKRKRAGYVRRWDGERATHTSA